MASQYLIDRDRGTKEASQQLAVLRERWPLAFPVNDEDVRPLAIAAASEIAAVMDWSIPYTLGVLRHWKMAAAYCRAVLSHEHRITLDGAPAEAVGTEAKDLAAKQLAKLAARKAAKKVANRGALTELIMYAGEAAHPDGVTLRNGRRYVRPQVWRTRLFALWLMLALSGSVTAPAAPRASCGSRTRPCGVEAIAITSHAVSLSFSASTNGLSINTAGTLLTSACPDTNSEPFAVTGSTVSTHR
jgi:sRNA-binding protein